MMDLQRVNAYMSKVEESEKKVLPHGRKTAQDRSGSGNCL